MFDDMAAENARYEENACDEISERYAAEIESMRHEGEAEAEYEQELWLADLAARGLTEAEGLAELEAGAEAFRTFVAPNDDNDDIPF